MSQVKGHTLRNVFNLVTLALGFEVIYSARL